MTEIWQEPARGDVLGAAFTAMPSSERIQRTVFDKDGPVPPIARLLGITVSQVTPDRFQRAGIEHEPETTLATVLFTDIVGSTQRATELGDARWNELLSKHHQIVREELRRFEGREIKVIGDGFLATFESPAKALRCARAIADAVPRLGIEVRAGVHTGECEVKDGDIGGLTVNIGRRIVGEAGPREVFVSGAVRDMLAGSSFRFRDRGMHQLKGVDGEWRLFAVEP